MKRLDEFALIRRLTRSRQETKEDRMIEVGIGDDAAVVSINEGTRLVTACDTMVETVHFNRWTMLPEHIGYKALASNVSDIAAMGGIPKYALVSISVPKSFSVKKLEQLYKGLHACADRYGVDVIGGDTTSSPRHFIISVTVIGEVEPGKACVRSAAQPGQAIFVTGYPGEAAAGLHVLMEERTIRCGKGNDMYRNLIAAHQMPKPSVEAGRMLLASGACGALNDISDGLASELHEISEASRLHMVIDEEQLPHSQELKHCADLANNNALDWILFGGEDYHLVGTVEQAKLPHIQTLFHKKNIPFFVIGEVSEEKTETGAVWLKTRSGQNVLLEKKGYNHF